MNHPMECTVSSCAFISFIQVAFGVNDLHVMSDRDLPLALAAERCTYGVLLQNKLAFFDRVRQHLRTYWQLFLLHDENLNGTQTDIDFYYIHNLLSSMYKRALVTIFRDYRHFILPSYFSSFISEVISGER